MNPATVLIAVWLLPVVAFVIVLAWHGSGAPLHPRTRRGIRRLEHYANQPHHPRYKPPVRKETP